jgi:2-polyprenyl-3-methyl-5-hydroxy-6-metoxy-1,4-benzoquinol methylase
MIEHPWNHNIHYHSVVLDALPEDPSRVLDVGCGAGLLARRLRRHVPHVVALDADEPILEVARTHPDAGDIEYAHGDILSYPFEPSSFDAVVAVAALHHMDATTGLQRMHDLVRPGGSIVVIGLARSRHSFDAVCGLAGIVATQSRRIAHGPPGAQGAPVVWPPPETYQGMRRIAREQLPGAVFRRRIYFRYSLVWRKSPANR